MPFKPGSAHTPEFNEDVFTLMTIEKRSVHLPVAIWAFYHLFVLITNLVMSIQILVGKVITMIKNERRSTRFL